MTLKLEGNEKFHIYMKNEKYKKSYMNSSSLSINHTSLWWTFKDEKKREIFFKMAAKKHKKIFTQFHILLLHMIRKKCV